MGQDLMRNFLGFGGENYGLTRKEDEILRICKRRINIIFQNSNDPSVLKKMFPRTVKSDNGKDFDFEDYFIARTNLRPRDAIVFLSYMFRECIGKNIVQIKDVKNAEGKYSTDRLSALFHEWKNPYKGISFLKNYFSYTNHKLSKKELIQILDSIFDFAEPKKEDDDFEQKWLFSAKLLDPELNNPTHPKLIIFLFRIGLIGFKHGASTLQFSFAPDAMSLEEPITDQCSFYINPCYHRALNTRFHAN